MIEHYDPNEPTDPKEWLELDEELRHLLVREYHRDARVPLPSKTRPLHAAIHVVVENQQAMEGPEIVRVTLLRLLE